MPAFYRIAVVGARRHRQGTGAFIAAHFAELGHTVCAIVGTSDDSLAAASKDLQLNYGIAVKPYPDVKTLLAEQDIDVLAIASPDGTHLEYLEDAARANCHVFCEKPLWWPADGTCPSPEDAARTTTKLIKRFDDNGHSLFVNLQWPHTLPSFQRLYPDTSLAAENLTRFEMRLSPESTGPRMVIDSAPHPLSMLYRLLGSGDILNAAAHYDGATRDTLTLTFNYHHTQGDTIVTLKFKRHPGQPKPAGYAINGNPVERCVKMPDYLLSLAAHNQSIAIKDPLKQSIETFVDAIRNKTPNQRHTVVAGMRHLCQLVQVCEKTHG